MSFLYRKDAETSAGARAQPPNGHKSLNSIQSLPTHQSSGGWGLPLMPPRRPDGSDSGHKRTASEGKVFRFLDEKEGKIMKYVNGKWSEEAITGGSLGSFARYPSEPLPPKPHAPQKHSWREAAIVDEYMTDGPRTKLVEWREFSRRKLPKRTVTPTVTPRYTYEALDEPKSPPDTSNSREERTPYKQVSESWESNSPEIPAEFVDLMEDIDLELALRMASPSESAGESSSDVDKTRGSPRSQSLPYYEAGPLVQSEELHQHLAAPSEGHSEEPTPITSIFNDYASRETPTLYPIPDETISSVDSDDVPDLTGRIVKTGPRAIFDGTYSTVYHGYCDDEEVAIKVIRGVKHIQAMRRKIKREVDTWWHCSHPNILPLLGFAEGDEFGAFGAMISPWCHNGNAADYMAQGLNMAQRIQLFRDVAEGLQYLHNPNPIVVHGDLKPANVLITRDGVAQLCDFGLVRLVHDQMATGLTTTTAHTGTARYLSLELVEADEGSIPTTASDMYALGCIGMEFIYSQSPYNHIQTTQSNAHFKICREISMGIPPARRPKTTNPVISILWDIFEECWESDPENRPTAYYLCDYLDREAHHLINALNA